jgi:hypothetical protein
MRVAHWPCSVFIADTNPLLQIQIYYFEANRFTPTVLLISN